MASLDTVDLPQSLAARVAASIGYAWRAVVGAGHPMRSDARICDRDALERDALAGFGAHMLKDIGASSWLVAGAASHARDEFQRRIDALY